MLLPILTMSLEKEIIVLEKLKINVWKKSLILQPKICTNPVEYSDTFPLL